MPDLNLVFGLADQTNQRAVIALLRPRESWYGRRENEGLFIERAMKEALHELGHIASGGRWRPQHTLCSMYVECDDLRLTDWSPA